MALAALSLRRVDRRFFPATKYDQQDRIANDYCHWPFTQATSASAGDVAKEFQGAAYAERNKQPD
jgi:hypothetical protein